MNVLETDSAAGENYQLAPTNSSPIVVRSVDSANLVQPLSTVTYVDIGTTTPLAQQTGSIAAPFTSASDGLNSLPPAGALLIVGGNYASQGPISFIKPVQWLPIADPNAVEVAVDSLVITAGPVNLNNTIVNGTTAVTGATLAAHTCGFAGAVSGTGIIVVDNCTFTSTVGGVFLVATNSRFNANITLSSTSATFSNCTFNGTPVITFSGAPGVVTLDDTSFASWISSGASVLNGSIATLQNANSLTVTQYSNDHSVADLALGTNALTDFPAFTFSGINLLPASSAILLELMVEIVFYRDSDHSTTGQVDFTVQLGITTDASHVATCTLNSTPVPNVSYLPVALAGATGSVVASAGGYTVQAQRPAGIACHARYFVTWGRVNDVT